MLLGGGMGWGFVLQITQNGFEYKKNVTTWQSEVVALWVTQGKPRSHRPWAGQSVLGKILSRSHRSLESSLMSQGPLWNVLAK